MKNQCSGDPKGYNESVPKVTFANTGQTVEFEHGKLPYDDHGKPESILDVALNFGVQLEARLRRKLRLHHLPRDREERRR